MNTILPQEKSSLIMRFQKKFTKIEIANQAAWRHDTKRMENTQ